MSASGCLRSRCYCTENNCVAVVHLYVQPERKHRSTYSASSGRYWYGSICTCTCCDCYRTASQAGVGQLHTHTIIPANEDMAVWVYVCISYKYCLSFSNINYYCLLSTVYSRFEKWVLDSINKGFLKNKKLIFLSPDEQCKHTYTSSYGIERTYILGVPMVVAISSFLYACMYVCMYVCGSWYYLDTLLLYSIYNQSLLRSARRWQQIVPSRTAHTYLSRRRFPPLLMYVGVDVGGW